MSKQPKTLNDILKLYLENVRGVSGTRDHTLELEAKFGTRNIKNISKIDYDNVVKYLISSGFTASTDKYKLRIFNEFIDPKTGATKISHIRTELSGISNISKYCKNNVIVDDAGMTNAAFENKSYFKKGEEAVYPVNFDDYNFRVTLQKEISLSDNSNIIRSIIDKWTGSKKIFRYMCRNTFTHPKYPLRVDLSVVKNSRKQGKQSVPEYKLVDSGVLDSPENYEIEIELDYSKIFNSEFENIQVLENSFRKVIKLVLSGLQGTNFPISYTEQVDILDKYMTVMWKDKHKSGQRITPKNFVGPSQFTLQINNIVPNNETFHTPNIRKNYTVTEKADGDRKLLFIANNGKMYFINTNMVVEFTGAVSLNKLLFNTIIDGEHIKVNKKGDFINIYAAFDLYYLNNVDTRSHAFAPTDDDEVDSKKKFRLLMLSNVIKDVQAISIMSKKSVNQKSPVTFVTKRFYQDKKSQSIFEGCAAILQNVKDGNYDYETDGLIFTPSDMGVGSNKIGVVKDPLKTTWEHSFKWKPAEFNTIDFLVTTKKGSDGNDEINNIFQGGKNTNAVSQLSQYKTLILRVGYDEKKHGYLNPCQNVIDGEVPTIHDKDSTGNYRPMQF